MRIVNLAYLMLTDERFDVGAYLARLRPRLFGIDLHWLPHAHGALAIAELAKRLHPGIPVLIGGLSASYYHEELARHLAVHPKLLARLARALWAELGHSGHRLTGSYDTAVFSGARLAPAQSVAVTLDVDVS